MIRFCLALVALATLVLTGCSSMQVVVEKNPDADFKSYTSWDWFPGERQKTGDPRTDLDGKMNDFIKKTISDGMRDRGYKHEPGSSRLYVDYQVSLSDQINSQLVNNYYGESFYPGYRMNLPGYQDTYKMEWEEGALLIMVFDSSNKEMVWRGIASTEVNSQGPRQEARDHVVEAVGKLMKKLPGTGITVKD